MTNIDNEELEQESFILMLDAIDKFDVSRGSFSTYLLVYLKNSLRKVLQYNQDISLEQPINDLDGEEITLQDTLQDEKTTQEVLSIEEKNIDSDVREEIKTTLGKEIADIVFKKYGINSAVKTVKELAYIYNMSDKEITNLLDRAKRSLRNNKNLYYYLLDYLDVDYNYGGSIIKYRDKTNVIHDSTGYNAVRLSELKTRIENDYYIREEKKELQKQIDDWLKKKRY
ncbi:MAG: sigma factor [Finegoldia magna]|nr:sigma factor [Finegoldia magna]